MTQLWKNPWGSLHLLTSSHLLSREYSNTHRQTCRFTSTLNELKAIYTPHYTMPTMVTYDCHLAYENDDWHHNSCLLELCHSPDNPNTPKKSDMPDNLTVLTSLTVPTTLATLTALAVLTTSTPQQFWDPWHPKDNLDNSDSTDNPDNCDNTNSLKNPHSPDDLDNRDSTDNPDSPYKTNNSDTLSALFRQSRQRLDM